MAPIIIGGLLQGSVFAIIALGFALVYRVTGVINLSQGAFCIVGALSMYTLELTLELAGAARRPWRRPRHHGFRRGARCSDIRPGVVAAAQ